MLDNLGQRVLDQIKAAGRRVLPMHDYLAKADPQVLDSYNRFLTSTIYEKNALSDGHKEMVLACACLAAGSSQPVIANHCRKAMAAGLDETALLQALEITAAVLATQAMANGVTALIEAKTS